MNLRSLTTTLLLVAACGGVTAVAQAADAPAKSTTDAQAKLDKPADVQKAVDQFSAKRDALIAGHQALLDKLATATAEQKKALLAQMQAQQKDLLETQRELARQIRDELRKLRQSQPAGGR